MQLGKNEMVPNFSMTGPVRLNYLLGVTAVQRHVEL